MTKIKKVIKKSKTTYNIIGDVNEYNMLRQRKGTIEKRMKELSERIKSYALDKGTKDNKGNMYITNDDNFIFGAIAKKRASLNEEKAKKFLLSRGLYEKCVQTIEKIDEDKLATLVKNKELTLEELEKVTDIQETYSLDVKEKKNKEEVPEIQPTKLRK